MVKNPVPQGKYVPAVKRNGFIFTAGMTPRKDGVLIQKGKVEAGVPLETYQKAVEQAAKNALTAAQNTLAPGERIVQIMQLVVYVNAGPDFTEHTALADFASAYLAEKLGLRGLVPVRPLAWQVCRRRQVWRYLLWRVMFSRSTNRSDSMKLYAPIA